MQISVLICNHSSDNQKCIQLFLFHLSFTLFFSWVLAREKFLFSSRPNFFFLFRFKYLFFFCFFIHQKWVRRRFSHIFTCWLFIVNVKGGWVSFILSLGLVWASISESFTILHPYILLYTHNSFLSPFSFLFFSPQIFFNHIFHSSPASHECTSFVCDVSSIP